jgi:general secretion pathway protein D
VEAAQAATANEAASAPVAVPAETTQPPAAPVEAAPAASQPLVELPPLVVPPAGDGTLSITVPGGVKTGETFPVEVSIVGANALFSAPLFVNFDPALLKFVRGEEGDLLKRGGVATVFAISPMPNQGQLIVGYKQGVGSAGASGDGLLFRLHFSAIAPGSAAVKLERINFRNPTGSRLKVEPTATSVEIR